MHNENPLDLEPLLHQATTRRRKLIPILVKIFIWIFIVFSCFVPIVLLTSLFGYRSDLALYGLETNDPLSTLGLALSALFILKGIVGFALWAEKNWAVKLAIADAVIGIGVCLAVMLAPLWSQTLAFSFRLELFVLILYLIWLSRIKVHWESLL